MRFVDLAIVSSALGVVILRSDINGAAAGFILTFAGMITNRFRAVLLTLRLVETSGVNLERVAEFCALEIEEGCSLKDISGDADDEDPNDSVAPGWPTDGRIEVQGLCARYGPDMPDILHGVTFSSEGGERIGIVGATGGGKSTLAKAFFSFVDLTAGSIKIDGRGECSACPGATEPDFPSRHCHSAIGRCPVPTGYHCAGPYLAVGLAPPEPRYRRQALRCRAV